MSASPIPPSKPKAGSFVGGQPPSQQRGSVTTGAPPGTGGAGHHHRSVLDHEEAFFLIKPDAAAHHAAILQMVGETGLQITMQSFVIRQSQAEAIVSCYPSVSAAREAARYAMSLHHHTKGSGDNDAAAGGVVSVVNRRRPPSEQHRSITNDIMKIARRGGNDANGEGRSVGVHAGLSSPDLLADATPVSGELSMVKSGESRRESWMSGTKGRKSTSRTSSSDLDLAHEHERHLVAGGTCLAFIVAGPNAIGAMQILAGPEDPEDAQISAPRSVRARFGKDVVRNAVFAATSSQDATHLIRVVFGVEGGHTDGSRKRIPGVNDGMRRATDVPDAAAVLERIGKGTWSNSPFVVAAHASTSKEHPPMSSITFNGGAGSATADAGEGGDEDDEDTASRLVDTLFDSNTKNAAIQRRGHGQGMRPVEGDAVPGALHAGDHGDASITGGVSAKLAKVLADERKRLLQQSKSLRLRELDLLLREQELFRIASGFASSSSSTPASPSPRQGQQPQHPTSAAAGAGAGTDASTVLSSSSSQTALVLPSSLHLEGNQSRSRGTTSAATATRAAVPGPSIAESDVDELVHNPRRVGFLFHLLDSKRSGFITNEDFVQLYLRSPCLSLVGHENPVAHLLRTVPTQMNLESFTMALLHLLRM